jgi:hypothetical protein
MALSPTYLASEMSKVKAFEAVIMSSHVTAR